MKIKILKTFLTTHYGYLQKNQILDCHDGFADYVVNRMKAGEIISEPKKAAKKTVKKGKK